MLRIIIQGLNGRMGKALYALINDRADCEVVAGIDLVSSLPVPTFKSLNEADVMADVVIDFSNPAATMAMLGACKEKKLPAVICTTGLTPQQQEEIDALSLSVPIFQSANMSLGINVLIELAKKANKILGLDYDVEIIEKHHNNKLDAPSGTAIMIAKAINDNQKYNYVYDRTPKRQKRDKNEIGMHCVRGGGIVGEHDVLFCGANETITLSHSAASREVFASGAVSAALFLAKQQPGMYNMKDLIG